MSAEEILNAAYALEKDASLEGTQTLTGVIVSVDSAYNSQYGNVTVTILVNDITDKPMKCFRIKGTGADTIKVGDTITVSGTITNYGGTIEFASGSTLDAVDTTAELTATTKLYIEATALTLNVDIKEAGDETVALAGTTYTDVAISYASNNDCAVVDNTNGKITYTLPVEQTFVTITATLKLGETEYTKTFSVKVSAAPKENEATVTLSFADKTSRVSQDNNSQVWKDANKIVTLTNNKASSTSNVGDYAPIRLYKSSSVTIDCKGMTQIVFNCNDFKDTYASDLVKSITEDNTKYTVTSNGTVVIIQFTESVDTFEIASLNGQVRLDSIEVTYTTDTNE